MRQPLDPFSKVLDERSHWDPEWYSWLQEISASTTRLETRLETDLPGIEARLAALEAAPSGLVFLLSQTASNTAAIVFTGIDSTYDAYQFYITKMRPSVSASAPFCMQMSINGGSTWKNTGNLWSWVYSYVLGGAAAFGHTSTAAGDTTQFHLSAGTRSDLMLSVEATLYPSSGSGTGINMATWRGLVYRDDTQPYQQIGSGAEVTDLTPCNAVRFYFASGNMISGRISMYGLRKT